MSDSDELMVRSGLSSLPSEILLHIFELATYVPFELNTDPPNAFAYPKQWSDEEIEEANLRSMVVKRRLVLVCKQWNILASPFLYRIIVIRKSYTAHRLASTLKSFSSTASELSDSSGPGEWTKRLDICFRKNDRLLLTAMTDFLEDIRIIIRSFSNLEVLVVKDKMSETLLNDLSHTFSISGLQKLRKLDVYSQYELEGTFDLKPYRALIGLSPHLRFLKKKTPFLILEDREICMENIEFLDIESTFHGPFKTCESNSESKSSLSMVWDMQHSHKFAGVLENIAQSSYGGRLTVLEVNYLSPWEFKRQKECFHKSMHVVAKACPNLRELIIRVALYRDSISIPFIPPVKKLGIRLYLGLNPTPKARWKKLCGDLVSLVENTRTIDIVRILNGPSLNNTQSHAGVLKVLRDASRTLDSIHGVRLEDDNGFLYHDGTQKKEA